jgi:hypothetical protein
VGFNLGQAAQQAQDATAKIATAPAQAQQAWTEATSPAANDARVQQGASDAVDLVEHGYDSSNEADNQKLIGAIAGGVSLIPGIGPMLGGAIGLLDAIAVGVADALTAIGLIPKPGCHSSGTFTPAEYLSEMKSDGAMLPAGSFAAVALPAMAYSASERANCRPSFQPSTVLAGMVQLWNKQAQGNLVDTYLPAPSDFGVPYAAGANLTMDGHGQRIGLRFLMRPMTEVAAALGLSVADAKAYLAGGVYAPGQAGDFVVQLRTGPMAKTKPAKPTGRSGMFSSPLWQLVVPGLLLAGASLLASYHMSSVERSVRARRAAEKAR